MAKKLIDIKRNDIIGKFGLNPHPGESYASLTAPLLDGESISNLTPIEVPEETAVNSIAEGDALGTIDEDEAQPLRHFIRFTK